MKQITVKFDENFNGTDIIIIVDLRQLPPVKATLIYQRSRNQMAEPVLWQGLKSFELTKVMRQSNLMFSTLLTKMGNGEVDLIKSRFFIKEEGNRLCPNIIHLFSSNASVNRYNICYI